MNRVSLGIVVAVFLFGANGTASAAAQEKNDRAQENYQRPPSLVASQNEAAEAAQRENDKAQKNYQLAPSAAFAQVQGVFGSIAQLLGMQADSPKDR
jgi:hypothetical protein